MVKTVLSLLMCFSLLSAVERFDFKETRYSYALDKHLKREGTITFDPQSITIVYDKPEMTILTFFRDAVTIQHTDKEQILKESDNPLVYYMFIMLKAIFTDDMQTIRHYFDISEKEGMTELAPRDMATKYITAISFRKKSHLTFLQITLTNGDSLTIEPIH